MLSSGIMFVESVGFYSFALLAASTIISVSNSSYQYQLLDVNKILPGVVAILLKSTRNYCASVAKK